MKHDYFIEDLGQAVGWFKPHRYRYSCLRCGWKFMVEDRGMVNALDEFGDLCRGRLTPRAFRPSWTAPACGRATTPPSTGSRFTKRP